jgi:hypothetical protein
MQLRLKSEAYIGEDEMGTIHKTAEVRIGCKRQENNLRGY